MNWMFWHSSTYESNRASAHYARDPLHSYFDECQNICFVLHCMYNNLLDIRQEKKEKRRRRRYYRNRNNKITTLTFEDHSTPVFWSRFSLVLQKRIQDVCRYLVEYFPAWICPHPAGTGPSWCSNRLSCSHVFLRTLCIKILFIPCNLILYNKECHWSKCFCFFSFILLGFFFFFSIWC